ncbi:MAG: right-handed parallel beta-helix repeat-containing protein [Acidobacteriota bacterium]|nr:right-handed parallel beta-helix repeat-containing protein [Acidobacteriota bacterium]
MTSRRYLGFAAFIAAPLLIALTAGRSQSLRPQPPELRAGTSLVVISSRDSGGGTLREAIVAAARHDGTVRIVVNPTRITLLSPLPPLVNAAGIVLDATQSRCEIDAGAIGDTPALQVASPGSTIAGLRIRNARGSAILVRAPRVTLRGVGVRDSADGVVLAAASGAVIERSSFERNTNGVRIDGSSPGAIVRGCTFQRHDGAGVWAVNGTPAPAARLRVENNTFRNDRVSLVVVNLGAMVTRNDIRGAVDNGMYLMQSRSVVRSNRVLGGEGSGILADRSDNLLLDRNEVDHNAGVGILVRSCRNTNVQRNLIYANAYGIASVFGDRGTPNVIAENLVMMHRIDGVFLIGSSPLLRANRILQNGSAAARVLDFVPWSGARIASDPRFDANTIRGNKIDLLVRGEYRPKREPEARQ